MHDKETTGNRDLSKSESKDKYLPIDPSHTSQVGEKIETPIVKPDEGISQQSAEWEDKQERGDQNSIIPGEAERYIKDPSPEDMDHDERLEGPGKTSE